MLIMSQRLPLVDSDQKLFSLFLKWQIKEWGKTHYIVPLRSTHPRNSFQVKFRLLHRALPADIRETGVRDH